MPLYKLACYIHTYFSVAALLEWHGKRKGNNIKPQHWSTPSYINSNNEINSVDFTVIKQLKWDDSEEQKVKKLRSHWRQTSCTCDSFSYLSALLQKRNAIKVLGINSIKLHHLSTGGNTALIIYRTIIPTFAMRSWRGLSNYTIYMSMLYFKTVVFQRHF